MAFDAETTERTVTRDRVMRLRDFLAALPPEKFNMDDYLVWDGDGPCRYSMPIGKAVNVCGTAACIAGWAQALFDPNGIQDEDEARKLLGLTPIQADALFMPVDCTRADLTTTQAVAVLDNYLATGEINWAVAK